MICCGAVQTCSGFSDYIGQPCCSATNHMSLLRIKPIRVNGMPHLHSQTAYKALVSRSHACHIHTICAHQLVKPQQNPYLLQLSLALEALFYGRLPATPPWYQCCRWHPGHSLGSRPAAAPLQLLCTLHSQLLRQLLVGFGGSGPTGHTHQQVHQSQDLGSGALAMFWLCTFPKCDCVKKVMFTTAV